MGIFGVVCGTSTWLGNLGKERLDPKVVEVVGMG